MMKNAAKDEAGKSAKECSLYIYTRTRYVDVVSSLFSILSNNLLLSYDL